MTSDRRGRALAWLMFLPAGLLLTFAVRQRVTRPSLETPYDSPAEPDQLGRAAPLAGWEGAVDLGEGCGLTLRFEPLHPDPRRQRFDAAALCRALRPAELSSAFGEDGPLPAEPWRLTLTGDGPADASDRVLVSGLSGVRIEGFEPVVPDGSRAHDPDLGPSDPIAAMLRFPLGVLTASERCDLVFWGPAPGVGDGDGPVLSATVPGVRGPVSLAPAERSGFPSTRSLAVLDGAGPAESREDGGPGAVSTGEAQPPPR